MDAILCRKIGLSKEFVVGLTRLLFEEMILKKEENAKEKELVAVHC